MAATFATSTASSAQLQLELPHFDVTISRGAPLGIVSLKMKGQQADFADSSGRPLADWELFWLQVFAVDSRPSEPGLFAKLIDPYWPSAEIEERADWRIVRFRRTNVLRAGNTLGLEYWLSLTEPVFEVHYKIENAGRRSLIAPFIMVGLPGFVNQPSTVQVMTAVSSRRPLGAYTEFLSEAIADGRDQYLLLRDDVSPAARVREMSGAIILRDDTGVYLLDARYLPDLTVSHVYSAHTNKPRYLTSHLYVFFRHIPPGNERLVRIRYRMTRLVATAALDRTWGQVKVDRLGLIGAPSRP